MAGTLSRLAICSLLYRLFLAGSYGLPVNLASVLGLAMMLGLLASYELVIRDKQPHYVLGALAVLIVVSLGGYTIWLFCQPPEPTGPLLPAGEASPSTTCREAVGANDLAMYFGTDRVVGRGAGPFKPFAVDSCPVISLRRKDGGLMVAATGYDWSSDIAFMVRDNLYRPLTPVQLHVLRPDRSTFILLDRFDQEVVYVRYLSRNAVRIRGRFLCGEAPEAVIRDSGIKTGGVRIGGVYFGQHPTAGRRCGEAAVTIGDPHAQW